MAEPKDARLAPLAAVCLTLAALFLNQITLASNDYSTIVLAALGCALAGLALIAASWRRQTWFVRLIALLAVLADGWILLDVLGRRLPALLRS